MNRADRLFARLAIHRNFVQPAQVEEARTYLEKLQATPTGAKLAPSIAAVLVKLGRLTGTQAQAVEREMEPFAFTCEKCAKKAYHLEHGDSARRCDACEGEPPNVPPPPAGIERSKRRSPGRGAGEGERTGRHGAEPGPSAAEKTIASPPPRVDMTARRARAASFDLGPAPSKTPPGGAPIGGSGAVRAGPGAPPGPASRGESSSAATIDEARRKPARGGKEAPAVPTLAAPRAAAAGAAGAISGGTAAQGIVASEETVDTGRVVATQTAPRKPLRPAPKLAAGAPGAPDPLVGKVVGGCRIEKFLGKGGMGTVYRAVQVDLDRVVALKILSPHLTADPRQVQQFLREARALAKLEHPNIVTIYNAAHDKESDVHFIAMQFVAGGSLEGVIKEEGGRLAPERAMKFIEQAARGLVEAHGKGIVHRDVKPDNMLVAEGEVLKVTDFGLARIEADAASFSFAEGRIVGTPYYMSPEQIDGRNVDHRTDIYALGGTLYYMLTGHKPFEGETPVEILLKHVNETLVPPARRLKGVPEGASRIVEKMMAKAPEARYQSLRDLLRDVEAVGKGGEVKVELAPEEAKAAEREEAPFSAAAAAGAPAAPRPAAVELERPRSLTWAAGGLAAAAVLAVALGFGPVRELMAEGEAMPESPREVEARKVLEPITAAGAPRSREEVEKLRGLASDHAGTRAGDAAAKLADQALEDLRRAAEDAARRRLAEAVAARAAGKHGAALDALASLPEELRGFGVEAALEAEAAAVREELKEQRGQAYVPAGAFPFGEDTRTSVRREVEVGAFYIDLTEVRSAEYAGAVKAGKVRAPAHWGGPEPPRGTEALPVTGISARDAEAYARANGKRLPTVYEWEKAARGAGGGRFPWGDAEDWSAANCAGSGPGKLEPVGSRPKGASPYGCLDMAGNAAEWVTAPVEGAGGSRTAAWVKGGAYRSDLMSCRAAFWNDALGRDDADPAVGFRLVQDVEPR